MAELDFLKTINVNFLLEQCCSCNIYFYIPESKYNTCKADGSNFFCPNGHSLIYSDNELTKEKKRREWAERSRDQYQKYWKDEEKKRRALKGQLTKTKNRISNGVCPCCKRSFQNLKKHIGHMHPEYKR